MMQQICNRLAVAKRLAYKVEERLSRMSDSASSQLAPLDRAAFDRLAQLGDGLRARLATAIRDRQAPVCVVGAASLFRLHPQRRVPREYRDSHLSAVEAKVMLALWRFFQGAGVNLPNGAAACLSTPMGDAEVDLIGATFERFLDEKRDLFAELDP